jgi:hypothetical protein
MLASGMPKYRYKKEFECQLLGDFSHLTENICISALGGSCRPKAVA